MQKANIHMCMQLYIHTYKQVCLIICLHACRYKIHAHILTSISNYIRFFTPLDTVPFVYINDFIYSCNIEIIKPKMTYM